MRNVNTIVLSAADTGSQTGAAIDSNQLISASFQVVFGDATAAGTLKIQASNDIYNARYNYPEGTFTPTNWSDIPNATVNITSGATSLIPKVDLSYRWIRVVYTRSGGGSTTLVCNMNALSV